MFENILGTNWEHKWELGERTLRTTKIQQPPSSKENEKRIHSLGACCNFSLVDENDCSQ
jgi:hypothetical protein